MMPKIRVRPADSRNSKALYCRPFMACSRNRYMGGSRFLCARPDQIRTRGFRRTDLLHLALRDVGVGVVLGDRADGLVVELAVAVALDPHQIPILDGVVVGVELEVAAHAFEVGLAQRFAEGVGLA